MSSAPARSILGTVFRLLTLRQISLWRLPCEPRAVSLLWLGGYLILKLASPNREMWYYDLAQPLAQLGLAVVAGLLAASILGKGGDALRFVFAFLLIALVCLLLQTALDQLASDGGPDSPSQTLIVPAFGVIAAVRFVSTASGWNRVSDKLRAAVAVSLVLAASLAWNEGERALFHYAAAHEDRPRLPDFDAEELWTAQPALVSTALAHLPAADDRAPRTFIVGVAAGGMQRLFGREVSKASGALAGRFGAGSGAAVLSNSEADIMRLPLANRTNLGAVLDEIGGRADPKRDLVVLYLASHGSRDGELSTGLPDYTRLQPVNADFLAEALHKARVGRRMIVVSACYSGSWIKPLASPDTILMTASAADRTSFGCEDKRDTTLFGEAFIRHMGGRGVSLQDAFARVRADIDKDETAGGNTHSLPQSFVGPNMQTLWIKRD